MKLIVCKNYDEMSRVAADIFKEQIQKNPKSILGLATGSTPIGMYKNLIKDYENKEISFKDIRTFNLDEYYKINKTNDQSYYYFMNDNLFSHIDIDKKNIDIPNGEADNYEVECERYDKAIDEAGGIDLQILGIGNNGHIAFNEPEEKLYANTHMTALTESTIEANARFFASADEVPKNALTMGMGSILKSKKIVILISGKAKAKVAKELLSGRITTNVPATLLNCHKDVVVIVDEDAYNG